MKKFLFHYVQEAMVMNNFISNSTQQLSLYKFYQNKVSFQFHLFLKSQIDSNDMYFYNYLKEKFYHYNYK